MPVRLFVGNLSYDATEAELREHFGTIGPVTYCYLPTDRETGRPRGFAFVEYGDDKHAQDAIARLNNQTFRGRPLAVKEAQPRESRPPGAGPRPVRRSAVAVRRARSAAVSALRRPSAARARAASAAVAARHRRQGRASANSVPTRRPRARRRTYTRAPRSAAPRARSARRPTTASTTRSAMKARTRTPPSTSTISRRASPATSLPTNPATSLPTNPTTSNTLRGIDFVRLSLRASSGGGSLARLPEGRPARLHLRRVRHAAAAASRRSARPCGPAAPPAVHSPVPAVLPDTCATVNGVTIGKAELETAIRSIEARNHAPVPAEKRDEVYRGVLDDLVSSALLKQEAVQRHVVARMRKSKRALAELRKQFGNEAAFEKAMTDAADDGREAARQRAHRSAGQQAPPAGSGRRRCR